MVIAIASNGLHTNGYSFARHVLFNHQQWDIDTYVTDLGMCLAEALLKPHVNYYPYVKALLDNQLLPNAMAHITGGGLQANLSRVIPKSLSLELATENMPVPAIFQLIQTTGQVETHEMYRAFNMGIGFCVVVAADIADETVTVLRQLDKQHVAILGEVK